MLDKIFKKWDIGIGNEEISFIHNANAVKVGRALRIHLAKTNDEYLHVNKFAGWMIIRLAQALYQPAIATAVEKMQDEIYGGAAYRIDVKRLLKVL